MNAFTKQVLPEHDVSDLVGLSVIVKDAAIRSVDEEGEETIEVPHLSTLSAAVAVARCLMPVRLRGHELRAMRRITQMTATEMAKRMGDKTSPETLSRWENEKQPMGGYAEKVFRLVVCEELKAQAPGVVYGDGAIARLNVLDPWRADPTYVVPPIVAGLVKIKSLDSPLVDAWADAA